jgi:hypothetical protein
MNMPTANEKALAARLLKLGLAPADAAAVASRLEALGKKKLTAEVLDAFGAPTAEDQLRARTWLLYQEGVPDEYKRLLDAGEA